MTKMTLSRSNSLLNSLRNIRVCSVCQIIGQDMTFCDDCDKWICDDCLSIHEHYKNDCPELDEQTKLNDILKQAFFDIQQLLTECKDNIRKVSSRVKHTATDGEYELNELKQIFTNGRDVIDSKEEVVVNCTRKYFWAIKGILKSEVQNVIDLLDSSEDTEANVPWLSNLEKENADTTTSKEMQAIQPAANINLQKTLPTENGLTPHWLPETEQITKPASTHTKTTNDNNLNNSEVADLIIATSKFVSSNKLIRNDTQIEYTKKHHHETKFKVSKCVELKGPVWKLYQLVDDEFWCVTSSSVQIFTKDCGLIRTVHLEKIYNARSLVQTAAGNLIVATSSQGIQLVDNRGKFIRMVETGKFSDCLLVHDKIYALKYNESKLLILEQTSTYDQDEKWQVSKQIKLGYLKGSQFDTLFVHKGYIYVCSWNNNCLYILKQNGVLLDLCICDEGSAELGLLKRPRVSSVDQTGNLLIADSAHERLLSRNEAGVWEDVMDLDGEVYDVVMSGDLNTVWVITDKSDYSNGRGSSKLWKLEQ